MYGTLIRNAGWTFAECGEQPACDVFDFLEHLADYPPDYVILAAVHLEKKAAAPKAMTEEQMAEQSQHLRSMMPTAPVPPHLRELMEWSKQQDELAAKKKG